MIGSINAHQHLWWSLAKAVDSEGMLRLLGMGEVGGEGRWVFSTWILFGL